ncbi:MAG: bifunctional diguanylate cyclase/phosphohydrolase [Candidatus Limnocylindria bacterium]
MLLALVFGIFLVLIGVTASALVAVASDHISSTTLSAIVSRDRDLIEFFVDGNLRESDLSAAGPSRARVNELRGQMETLASDDGITAMALRNARGEIVVAGGPEVDQLPTAGDQPSVILALGGEPSADLTVGSDTSEGTLEEQLPILSDGEVLGLISIRRDASSLLASLDVARRDVMVVTLAAAMLLAAVLYFVFRAAQARLTRQQTQLVEATRRDALTGMLNHGSIVAYLADAVDAARASDRQIVVALVDIDNFRLFNDTHGHEAGDEVLLLVARLVTDLEATAGHAARYGPDEFILVYPDTPLAEVQRLAKGLQASMRQVGVRTGDSDEELPVSVSIGLAAFPEHAASVTDLLSEASVALAEAKASGGDSVAIARRGEQEKVTASSFDVLQGLVIAVDTKDRYTKRHSEDVARYAVFLARQLGLDDDMLDMIHLAGLLHDIGKIGIPDALLRKPGKLTANEYLVFQQHVALGEAIVRDVPHVDLVRSGIKHHHERWDGKGYLEGLEGDGIPVIGRVLAVADAFSAMTTTRPYRKALSVEEALKRLGDAAGTQLQEELVTTFITSIETAVDAPLPGDDAGRVWRPSRKVAA